MKPETRADFQRKLAKEAPPDYDPSDTIIHIAPKCHPEGSAQMFYDPANGTIVGVCHECQDPFITVLMHPGSDCPPQPPQPPRRAAGKPKKGSPA